MLLNKRQSALRWPYRLLGWLALGGFIYGTYYVYRWAEPAQSALNAVTTRPVGSNLALSLEKVRFDNYDNGYKNWSVRAARIDVDRPPGGVAQMGLQRAVITGIQDGELYAQPARAQPSVTMASNALSNDTPPGPPVATFSAQQGRYAAGINETVPNDLQLFYTVMWQFKLIGNVRLHTREGEQVSAPSLTILELTNRHTGRLERRILCDQGADVIEKNMTVHANSVRYDPASRVVECTGGVRSNLHRKNSTNTVQSDSAFWSLHDQTLHFPGMVTGIWNGIGITAKNFTVDIKRHVTQASVEEFDFPIDEAKISLPGP